MTRRDTIGRVRPLRTIRVTRYVTPLREGGSLPAIVEADDEGLYVLKFRGAGQGAKALIAELAAGEIGRALGLPVPDIVFAELDPDLARTEPDPEIHALIHDSGGLNLAIDYLPGSVMFDPLVDRPSADLASRIVWFDACVTNVDRTARNPNMLMWHRRLWVIDHGASLYFHHSPGWEEDADRARRPFAQLTDHLLLPSATRLEDIDAEMASTMTDALIDEVVAAIPDAWLREHAALEPQRYRDAYARYLRERVRAPRAFVEEAVRAR